MGASLGDRHDDMQYFVVDVNSDGIYDNIYDENGMAVDNIPEGSLLADASDINDDIFISSDDDIQIIGHEYNDDMAVVDGSDMDIIEAMEPEQQEDPFVGMDEQLQADVLQGLEEMQDGLDQINTELSAVVDDAVNEFAEAVDEALDDLADILGVNDIETDADDLSSFTSDMDGMDDLSDMAMQ